MNLKKIYACICDAYLKKNRMICGHYDCDKVAISTDGSTLFIIPEYFFPFSVDSLMDDKPTNCIDRLIPSDTHPATLTGEMVKINPSITRVKLTDGIGETWVNIKNLQFFEKDAHYEMRGSNSAVTVYERGTLCGLIMPVTVDKEGDRDAE